MSNLTARLNDARPTSAEDAFLAHRGHVSRAAAMARSASAILEERGLAVRPADLLGHASASVRWLAQWGLVLWATRARANHAIRMARRCRHGLPDHLVVARVHLSHSQRLCPQPGSAAAVPAAARPASAGYRVSLLRRSPLGLVYSVRRLSEPAGQLVALETPAGPVWLQVGAGEAPALEAITAAARASYPDALAAARGS